MKTSKRSRRVFLRLEELESRLAPAASLETFDTTPVGTLPANWSQWSNGGGNAFAVSSTVSLSPPNSLAVSSPTASGLNARSWIDTAQPADMQVSAAVYLNSPIPGEVLARGTGLDTSTPSYYAVSVTQGLDLKLWRVDNGTVTPLGDVRSTSWIANQWANVTLYANGDNLRAEVQRNDTGQYLNSAGQWQSSQTWAINLTDNDANLSGGGDIGLGRLPSYTGTVYFDNFSYEPVTVSSQPPAITITNPAAGSTLAGVVPVQINATDPTGVTRVEFYVDNVLRGVDITGAPYTWNFDTTTVANGTHTLTIKAYDPAQNIGQASETITTQNDFTPLSQPSFPRHNPNIGLADIAYSNGSSQLYPSDIPLLQNSVDLVIPELTYLNQINSVAPTTPQLIYTNVSSLYGSLITDWDAYADANGYSREEAFYHVTQATPYSGGGGSTKPVNWFWGVYTGGSTLTDWTWRIHGGSGAGIPFGGVGQSVYIAYPEQFWEINVTLTSAASNGWSGVLEYPTAVDANGNPTAWAPLTTLGDTTSGFSQSGQITFNPPADWKPASINGSAPMYFVRIRTVTAGTAPVANTILGDDYTHANGGTSGVIPAYDWALDTNHTGYLDPAQYAIASAAGYTARFAYQSRLFTSYGAMRFATNPGDAAFRAWAVDYDVRFLNSNPLAAGLFMDNSNGLLYVPATPGNILEPTASYSTDYGSLLYEIGRAIAPRWILANVGGGGASATPTVQQVQGYFDEFAIRALASNYQQFEGLANLVASWAALKSPSPYAVLDSYPQGGTPTDPRMEMATLAYYYLIADPNTTFLDYDGGYDTTGPWSQHWFPAMGFNIGQPTGSWSLFAAGADPANSSLTYHIYQRPYSNGLVLYKPLSYGNGVSGTTADATATTQALGGTYYPLQADGTLGAPITSITLRNGEGAILVNAAAVATSFVVSASSSSTTAGAPVSFTVSAVDSAGQVVPGYTGTVHFTSTDGAAGLPADYTFTAADNGVHTFSIVFKTAGTQSLTVEDLAAGILGTQGGIVVNPAAASQFRLTAPAAVNALTPFQITITALDPYGNVVPSYVGTVHFTSSDNLAWLPADYTFTTADAGQHTFKGVILWQSGTQTISATDTKTATITGSTMVLVKKWASPNVRVSDAS